MTKGSKRRLTLRVGALVNGKKTLFKDVLDKNGYSDVPSIAK